MNKSSATTQSGAALLEVLVSMLIVAFGVIGFVGLQAQTTVLQTEAYQRSQALFLLNDFAQRIYLNKSHASEYVANDIGTTTVSNCSAKTTMAQRDLCEFALLIQGAAETEGTVKKGAMIGARACVTQTAANPNQYVVALIWQGVRASSAPINQCGKDAYSQEAVRRAVTTVVRIGTLTT